MLGFLLIAHNGVISWRLTSKARKRALEKYRQGKQAEQTKKTDYHELLMRGEFEVLEQERKRRRERRESILRAIGRTLACMISSVSE